MKGFFWAKIPDAQITPTIWKKIDDSDIVIDADSLVESFAAATPVAKEDSPVKAAPAAPKLVELIDSNKAKSVAIILSRFKMAFEDIARHIKQVDQDVFGEDQLVAMAGALPSPDEVTAIKGYDGDPLLLGKCEQFFLELIKVSNPAIHFDLMLLVKTYNAQIESIEPPLQVLNKGFSVLDGSKKLQKVFAVILKLGNFLNGGSTRGGTYGFKIESLAKLRDVRGQTANYTLLHCIVETMEKHYADMSDLSEEYDALKATLKVDLETVGRTLSTLSGTFNKCQRFLPQAEKLVIDGDLFHPRFTEFAQGKDEQLQELKKQLDATTKRSQEIITEYGELPSKIKLPDFLKALSDFCGDYTRAKEELAKQRAAKEKANRMKAARQPSTTNLKRGGLDKVMDSLVDGSGLTQLRPTRRMAGAFAAPAQPQTNELAAIFARRGLKK